MRVNDLLCKIDDMPDFNVHSETPVYVRTSTGELFKAIKEVTYEPFGPDSHSDTAIVLVVATSDD